MKNIHKKIFKKLNLLISNSIGLVAALAWNSAFQNLFKKYPELQKNGPWIYAIIVTVIAVVIITYLTQIEEQIDKNNIFNKSNLIFTIIILGAFGFTYYINKKQILSLINLSEKKNELRNELQEY